MVGVVGNFMTVVVMLYHKPLRRRLANYFLVNQALLNFTISVMMILSYNVGTSNRIPSSSIGLELYCRLWQSKAIFLGLFTGSIMTMMTLVVEKYVEIVHPIKHRVQMTNRRVVLILIVANLAGILFKSSYTVSTNIVLNRKCNNKGFPNSLAKGATGIANFLVEYLAPLTVITFCYIRMAQSLRKSIGRHQRESNPSMVRARNNIIKTLLLEVIIFVVCMTYKEFAILLQYTGAVSSPALTGKTVSNVAQLMAFMTCCVDPFIYLASYEEFQRGFLKLLFCRRSNMISTKNDQEFGSGGEHSVTSVKVTTFFEHRSKNVLDQPDN